MWLFSRIYLLLFSLRRRLVFRDLAVALILSADAIGVYVILYLTRRPRAREPEEPILAG